MSNLERIYEIFIKNDIKVIITVPDSMNSEICKFCSRKKKIKYIQTLTENDAVCIASGFNLTGIRTLIIMENSGVRQAYEIIARLGISHNIYSLYMLSCRGEVGEKNWWGIGHKNTMIPLLSLTSARWKYVKSISEFENSFKDAIDTFKTEQVSVALLCLKDFYEEIAFENKKSD